MSFLEDPLSPSCLPSLVRWYNFQILAQLFFSHWTISWGIAFHFPQFFTESLTVPPSASSLDHVFRECPRLICAWKLFLNLNIVCHLQTLGLRTAFGFKTSTPWIWIRFSSSSFSLYLSVSPWAASRSQATHFTPWLKLLLEIVLHLMAAFYIFYATRDNNTLGFPPLCNRCLPLLSSLPVTFSPL